MVPNLSPIFKELIMPLSQSSSGHRSAPHVLFLPHEDGWKMRKEGGWTNSCFTTSLSYTYLYSRLFSNGVSIWALTGHNTGMKRCLLGICKKAEVETVRGATVIPHTLRHWQIIQTIFSLKTERKVGRTHMQAQASCESNVFKHSASIWWERCTTPRHNLCVTQQ